MAAMVPDLPIKVGQGLRMLQLDEAIRKLDAQIKLDEQVCVGFCGAAVVVVLSVDGQQVATAATAMHMRPGWTDTFTATLIAAGGACMCICVCVCVVVCACVCVCVCMCI